MASTQLYNQDPLIDPIKDLTNSIKMSLHPNSVLPTNDKGLAYNFVNGTSNSADLMNTVGLADDYVKNLRIESNNNIYNDSINNMFTTMKAEQGFKAGPTVENDKLYNNQNALNNLYTTDQTALLSNPDFAKYSSDRGIDLNTVDSSQLNQLGKDFNGSNSNNSTIFGLDNKQWNSIGQLGDVGLAAGQLGLGIMGFIENEQTANKQRRLLNQQYENNKNLIADRKANKAALSKLHIS